jgi:hypothetical protein
MVCADDFLIDNYNALLHRHRGLDGFANSACLIEFGRSWARAATQRRLIAEEWMSYGTNHSS